jgi:alkylation response protein AidB-like acyl-CoA dehydrogenase
MTADAGHPLADVTLLYSEVEEDLRATVRQLLGDRAGWPSVLARTEGDEPYDPSLWRALAAGVGVAGLSIPEKFGGAGATWRETAVVAEELGRAIAPVPFLGSVLATAALLDCEDEDLLGQIAGGERTAVLAIPLSTAPAAPDERLTHPARVDGEGVTGTVTSVADALVADVLIVPAGSGLYAVDAGDATRSEVAPLDLTRRLADVSFSSTPARLLADGPTAERAVRSSLTIAAAMLASEQLGVAQWCLDTTVDYLRSRHQFGRPVGSFQGLKHRLAELWVAITQARAVARYAAGCVAEGDPDAPIAVAVAQAHCSTVAVRAAEECVQMHGGIGFTWEHPAHLYLKRAKSDAIALGTPGRHRATLARLVDLPPD